MFCYCLSPRLTQDDTNSQHNNSILLTIVASKIGARLASIFPAPLPRSCFNRPSIRHSPAGTKAFWCWETSDWRRHRLPPMESYSVSITCRTRMNVSATLSKTYFEPHRLMMPLMRWVQAIHVSNAVHACLLHSHNKDCHSSHYGVTMFFAPKSATCTIHSLSANTASRLCLTYPEYTVWACTKDG